MENITIAKTYQRYLNKINEAEAQEIPSLFGRLKSFLQREDVATSDTKRLRNIIENDALGQTVVQCRKKETRFKDAAEQWDSSAVQNFYKLKALVNTYTTKVHRNQLVAESETEQYQVNIYRLLKLLEEQEDPSLELYLATVYVSSMDGEKIFFTQRQTVKKLFNAKTEEEVEEIVQAS